MAQHRRPAARAQQQFAGATSGRSEVVRIKTLGGFRMSVGSQTVADEAWHLKKAAALVKLLALAPVHRLHREQVMDLLWPNRGRKAASNNLRQALHAARRALQPGSTAGSTYLVSRDEHLVLCPNGRLWVDVDAFEEAAAIARRSGDPAAYRAAIELYAGELLPEDRYENWAEQRREEVRQLHLGLLVELAGAYEGRDEYGRAIETLRRVVEVEPTHEEAHAGLMRLYVLSDREGEALAQYERLEEVLSRRLGTKPSTATRRLRDEIAAGLSPSPQRPSIGPSLADPVDSNRHNLPVARTSFVGREREMLEVKRALAMTNLLTLTGPGGSGKTRLALEVARDLIGAYPDGVWLVELAPLSEGELLSQAVAQALGVREQPGHSLTDTLAEALRAKELILVLDNSEHLVDSVAALVETFLDSCPRLRVLATSREALSIADEVVLKVSRLSVPDAGSLPAAEEMTRYEAVRLFLDRAQLRREGFELTSHNAEAVAEVCRRLEGIPLAIELAAARMDVLTPEQIVKRLDRALELLTGGRVADRRHQALRATLDWSYELLSEPERKLFRRLSTFAGGWTLEAAEVVGAGGGIEEGDVVGLFLTLVDKSLVVTEATGDGGFRYRMLEPVRQYAREKLDESGEAEAIRHRHAEFFLALGKEAETELRGPRQGEWLRRLEIDHDNLRASLGWAFGGGDIELGLRLMGVAWLFWDMRGHLSEGRRWLENGISLSGPTTTQARAKALNGAGWIATWQGDYAAAQAFMEESLALHRELGDQEGVADALINLGLIALLGDRNLTSVPALVQEAESLRPRVQDQRTVAYLLILEGLTLVSQGYEEHGAVLQDETLAARFRLLHEESLAILREIGDVRGMGICLTNLGLAEVVLGNYVQATTLLRELLRLSLGLDDKLFTQYACFGLACVSASQGRPVRAARLWAAADAVREASGMQLPTQTYSYTNYEDRFAATRTQLGEAIFEEAWAAGRHMNPEEVAEYAFSDEELTHTASSVTEHFTTEKQRALLTKREQEVAVLVARGLTNHQIASELSVSEHTVASHVAKILRKLRVGSRAQIASWVTEQRLPS